MKFNRKILTATALTILCLSLFVGLTQLEFTSATVISSYQHTISGDNQYLEITENASITSIAIYGNSRSNIIIEGHGNTLTGDGGDNGVLLVTCTNVTIQNLNFISFSVGVKAITNCDTINVINCSFYDSPDAVTLGSGQNYVVQNCYARNMGVHSFRAMEAAYNVLFDNVTSDSCLFGVTGNGVNGMIVQNSFSNYTTEVGFIFDYYSATPFYNQNITLKDSVSDHDKIGYKIIGSDHCLVDNFTVLSPSSHGFVIDNGSYNIFRKSKVVDGNYGFQFANSAKHNIIQQNNFTNQGLFGIYDPSGGENNTFNLNVFKSVDTNSIITVGVTNDVVSHNAYDSSAANSLGGTVSLNDTALALTVSLVGEGTISPTAATHAVNGGNWSVPFTATPDAGYDFANVTVNGIVVTSPAEITVDSTMVTTFVEEAESEPSVLFKIYGIQVVVGCRINGVIVAEGTKIYGVG